VSQAFFTLALCLLERKNSSGSKIVQVLQKQQGKNKQKIEEDKKWDGLRGYATNTNLTIVEVVDN
jgi:hypothetical protein